MMGYIQHLQQADPKNGTLEEIVLLVWQGWHAARSGTRRLVTRLRLASRQRASWQPAPQPRSWLGRSALGRRVFGGAAVRSTPHLRTVCAAAAVLRLFGQRSHCCGHQNWRKQYMSDIEQYTLHSLRYALPNTRCAGICYLFCGTRGHHMLQRPEWVQHSPSAFLSSAAQSRACGASRTTAHDLA